MAPSYLDVNAGFGFPITESAFQLLSSLGWSGFRQDVPEDSPDRLRAVVVDALLGQRKYSLFPTFLIGGGKTVRTPEQLSLDAKSLLQQLSDIDYPYQFAVEVVNEPDLSPRYRNNPLHLAHAVAAVASEILDSEFATTPRQVTLVLGGCMCPSPANVEFISRVLSALPGIPLTVAWHTYRPYAPWKPLAGYATRDDEIRSMMQVAGGRPVWVTEIGWSTGKRSSWPCVKPYSPETVRDWLAHEHHLLSSAGVERMTVYQHRCGPTNSTMDGFGILDANGDPRPAASLPTYSRSLDEESLNV